MESEEEPHTLGENLEECVREADALEVWQGEEEGEVERL